MKSCNNNISTKKKTLLQVNKTASSIYIYIYIYTYIHICKTKGKINISYILKFFLPFIVSRFLWFLLMWLFLTRIEEFLLDLLEQFLIGRLWVDVLVENDDEDNKDDDVDKEVAVSIRCLWFLSVVERIVWLVNVWFEINGAAWVAPLIALDFVVVAGGEFLTCLYFSFSSKSNSQVKSMQTVFLSYTFFIIIIIIA